MIVSCQTCAVLCPRSWQNETAHDPIGLQVRKKHDDCQFFFQNIHLSAVEMFPRLFRFPMVYYSKQRKYIVIAKPTMICIVLRTPARPNTARNNLPAEFINLGNLSVVRPAIYVKYQNRGTRCKGAFSYRFMRNLRSKLRLNTTLSFSPHTMRDFPRSYQALFRQERVGNEDESIPVRPAHHQVPSGQRLGQQTTYVSPYYSLP